MPKKKKQTKLELSQALEKGLIDPQKLAEDLPAIFGLGAQVGERVATAGKAFADLFNGKLSLSDRAERGIRGAAFFIGVLAKGFDTAKLLLADKTGEKEKEAKS